MEVARLLALTVRTGISVMKTKTKSLTLRLKSCHRRVQTVIRTLGPLRPQLPLQQPPSLRQLLHPMSPQMQLHPLPSLSVQSILTVVAIVFGRLPALILAESLMIVITIPSGRASMFSIPLNCPNRHSIEVCHLVPSAFAVSPGLMRPFREDILVLLLHLRALKTDTSIPQKQTWHGSVRTAKCRSVESARMT